MLEVATCSGPGRRPGTARCGLLLALAALAAAFAIAAPAAAGPLPPPKGDVLLVVKGAITNTNVGSEAHFDRELLESVGVVEINSRTAWHKDGAVFRGVPAQALMRAVGATGKTALATAANDYRITIPLTDFAAYNVLLATGIDGETLRLRTKGPIWMIYPEGVDLPEPVRQERMIWQLVELRIE